MRRSKTSRMMFCLGCLLLLGWQGSLGMAQTLETGKFTGYSGNACSGCGHALVNNYCNSCGPVMGTPTYSTGPYCGDECGPVGYGNACAVQAPCWGIGAAVKDIAHVAMTPVYWLASALSCGTYADCGCAPPVCRESCDPCDRCGNWVGCQHCGGVGCNDCAQGEFPQQEYASRGFKQSSMNMARVPVSNGSMVSANRNGNQPVMVAAQPTSKPIMVAAQPTMQPIAKPDTIVVPVQNVMTQSVPAPTQGNGNSPQYIFVTPDGQVIPQEQVQGFAQPGQPTNYQVLPTGPKNGIRPVSYEKSSMSPLEIIGQSFQGSKSELKKVFGK